MRVKRPESGEDHWSSTETLRFLRTNLTGHQKSKVGRASLLLIGVLINPSDLEEEKKPFSYDMEGSNCSDMKRDPSLVNGDLVLLHDGDQVMVSTDADPVRFLLISGKPIGKPVAWYGPVVMNTNDELRIAFEEFHNGTFVRQKTGKR